MMPRNEKESNTQNETPHPPPLLDRYLYLSLTKETVSMQPQPSEKNTFKETVCSGMNAAFKSLWSRHRLSSGRTLAP